MITSPTRAFSTGMQVIHRNILLSADLPKDLPYLCMAESTTRLPPSVINPSNCRNLHILLVYSRHTDSRVFWGYLRQTYCQHSVHRQTLLLVGSHAAPPPFETVFPHLYALLTVSLVLVRAQDLHVRESFIACPLSAFPCYQIPSDGHLTTSKVVNYIVNYVLNKKAVLSQRCPRDARYISRSWAVAEIWPFKIIQDGGGRHLE